MFVSMFSNKVKCVLPSVIVKKQHFRCPPLGSEIVTTTGNRDLTATAPDSSITNGGSEPGPLRLNDANKKRYEYGSPKSCRDS